jgi:SAM-dependent methyltransferase
MIQFPKKLEDFLLKYTKQEFYRGTKRATFVDRPFNISDLHFFAKGVSELSDLFTSERGTLDQGYLNKPPLRAGYLLYFLPINFAKACYVLNELPSEFWSQKKYRVLDLGCGPASASLAFLTQLQKSQPKAEVELILCDQNKNILRDAQALIHSCEGISKIKIQLVEREARRFQFTGEYDLILMSHVLNEWVKSSASERAEWLLPKLHQHLTSQGVIAILEPALKRPTRELMGLRDHLVESKELCVLAPCLHEEICPMLAATHNDWCHFYLEWGEPAYLQELDRLVKNDNRFLKVAYLLVGQSKFYQKELRKRHRDLFRMVSNRMATRGKTEAVLCGPPGRLKVLRLDRDRSPANDELDRLRRGDLVELPGLELKGYEIERKIRLNKNSRIKNAQRETKSKL